MTPKLSCRFSSNYPDCSVLFS